MAERPKFDPMAGATPIKSNASSGFDPMAGVVPIEKKNPSQGQNAMVSSGANASTDGNQEEDGFWGNVKGFASGTLDTAKWIGNAALGLAKGVEQGAVTVGQGLITIGSAMKNPYENTPGMALDEKYKLTLDQRMKFAGQVNEKLEQAKFEKAKGNASFVSLDSKTGVKFSAVDGEAFGEALGDNIVQFGLNALGPTGVMLNFAKNFEQTYQEARKQGIPADRALVESGLRGGIETYIEKKFGLESMLEKGLAQQGSKSAIKQITESILSEKAFGTTAKEAIALLSPKNIAAGFVKGFLPEAAEEFVQTVADNGAQELFNYYETSKKQNTPEAKLDLYRNQDENGNEVPVELWSKQTLVGGLNASIYGGLMGQMGGTFINSRSWNPTIYSSLQNAYDGTGKQGLAESKVQLANGVKKALEKGTIDQAGHDNALRNLDLMEQNIATFDQNSEIPSYTRFQLFNIKNNVVPEQINRMATQFAEAVASKEKPTDDAIANDLENNNTTEFVVKGSIANAPAEFRQFIGKDAVEENGETVFKGQVPNSLIAANENNKTQIQSIAEEAMAALSSLTDNERIVSVDDIKRLGQQGSPIFKDSRNQLAFEYAFQQNEKEFQRSARQINLLKSISKDIETNKTPITKAEFQKKIENLYKFNTGDTVFVDNKSAKILEISNNGQKLKISGINEQLDASDSRITLADEEVKVAPVEGQAEQAPSEQAPVEEQPIVAQEEVKPFPEEEQITGRTMRDAVGELIPFNYKGETGEIYTQSNGVVIFESPNKIYEFGNIKDIGDKSIDEFDIVPQEMSIGNDYSVTIDGKTFTNKNQNPFKAVTYDADGNVTSIKLESDKGQTRVIKGTRAVVIEAKYKVKKLYDESTREQLAAAAEDAANQAAAIEDTRGQFAETPTRTESKPVEQAPSIAEQERAARIREVAKKLLEQENPQVTANRQTIADLANSLFSSGIKVEVLTGDGIRAKYGKNVSQGMFLSEDGTVVINEAQLASEWGKTIIFHEGTHPIINIIRNTEPKLYKQLVAAIKDEAKTNPEVNKILQQIKTSPSYKEEFTRNDELVVEAIARVASGKLKLNDVKPTLRQAIVDFINKIAKSMGFKQVLKDSNQEAFNRLANKISDVLNTGRDIAEIVGAKNVGEFNTSQSDFVDSNGNRLTNGDVQFSLFNEITDTETGFSHQYLKDSNDFIKLVNGGSITNEKVLSDFEGKHLFFHAPDNAFSGNLLKDGKVVIKGQGGIFYPILNYAKKLLWASTSTASDKLVKYFNENAKLNNGSIYFGLVSTDPNKLLSSSTASVGVMDLFLEKAKDSSFDITEDEIKSYLVDAFKGKTILKDNKKGDKTIEFGDIDEGKLGGDLSSVRDYIESRLNPDTSSFDDRKYFVHRFLGNIAKNTKDYSPLAKQLGEFFHIKMENESFRGKYGRGYKISSANLIDNVSYILTEPLLKGQETGGKVYAVIEVSLKNESDKKGIDFDNIVSSIKSDSHKSYPDAIKINDDRFELKIHILQDRKEWYNNSLNNKTNSIVGKANQTSVMPTTAGITMGSVKIATQMSEMDRGTRVAPNGQPSNLNEYQYNAVRTPEFKAWFGDWENDPENASKVVDENGEPMVMYHGTSKDKDFDSFKISDRGAWFSSSPAEASSYASSNDSQKLKYDDRTGKYIRTNTSARVIPVFLNIKNLAKQEDVDKNILDEYRKVGYKSYRNAQKYLFNQVKYKDRNVEGFAFDTKDAGKAYNYAQVIVLFDGKSIEQENGTYKWFGNEFNVKSAIGSKFSPTNPKMQMSDIERTYTMESTVADAGMTMAEKTAWEDKNRVSQRQERNPFVQKAAELLRDGLITMEGYVNTVRENMPIYSMPEVPKIPTFKEIVGALNKQALNKGGIIGLNRTFADGERVASRLDIPAYNTFDTWVVSVHDGAGNKIDGKVLGYGQTAVLKNVDFGTMPSVAMNIAVDKSKATIARIFGDWSNEDPAAVRERAVSLMNDPAWTQVGMNPYRHSFFYDKADGTAVIKADEVIQVGSLVLAKNVVKAPFGSQAFIDNFSYKNKEGKTVQFSDMSRDDKRVQFVRDNINNYSKSELTEGLMQAFNLTKDAAERIFAQATADPLAPSIPQDNPDTAIPKGAKLNQKSQTTEKYNSGYDKAKKALLDKAGVTWDSVKKYVAEQYDSKFFGRRKLGLASSQESLAQARLRNLNGIAYSASQDLAIIYNDIFGNGLETEGERTLNAMIFNLRILQVDANTEVAYADEIEKLTLDFADKNNRMPSSAEALGITKQARINVPIKKHGKTLDGSTDATSLTAKAYLDALRVELGDSEYNMLKTRADMYRKVGNEQVEKLRAAGIISNEVAENFKDDFYSYRKTLDRLYGEQDMTITMLNGVASIKGWASLSKEGTENFLEQDARLLLAESYIGTARAIAKNKLRESIYEENIKTDEDGNESSVVDKTGKLITFIKPANYIRDKDGNILSNNKQLSVRDAEKGYVNVPYKKDGVINYFQMDAEMFEQIEGNNIKWREADAYYSVTDFSNRILTGMATRKNPMFWIGNIPMDLQQQVFFTDIWTQGNALQSNVFSAGARALARTIKFSNFFNRNKDFVDNTLAEFIAAGGAMDRMSSMKEQRKRTIEIALNEGERNEKWQMIKKKANAVLFGLNERTELAMRLAAYDQAKNNLIKKFEDENGSSPSESDMLKIQEIAASQARGYTDFAQRGTDLPNLNIAYLNSSIQAAGSALEYSVDNPAKIASKLSQLAIGKFAGTIALMALMGDAYDDLDEYTKDLYSFLYAFDTKLKDANGKPIMVTATVKNNPSLVPFMGVTRTFAEMTMRHLQGKEQNEITAQGSADRFFELVNVASPVPVPNITSIEGFGKGVAKLVTKHTVVNAFVRAYGYDAFRDKNVVSIADESLSPYMQGMNDKNVAYFYKAIAKSMANNSSANQVSPAKLQALAETFITSPSTNGFVAIAYGVLSSAANAIVPAQSDTERGEYSISDPSKVIKSATKRFASFTDSEKTEFRKNEELYKRSKEESMRYNDIDRNIDVKLKEMYKADPNNFFENVDKFAKEKGYFENDMLMERIDRKSDLIDKNQYNRSFINENIANEVKILHFTQGAEGKAKLLKYMFDKDTAKAREVVDGLIDYGTSKKEAYDTEDIYLKMIGQ